MIINPDFSDFPIVISLMALALGVPIFVLAIWGTKYDEWKDRKNKENLESKAK